MSNKRNRNKVMPFEITPIVLSNEPDELRDTIIRTIYNAAGANQLAYMDGQDPDTGEIVPLLVGLQPAGNDRVNVWPLARLFTTASEVKAYLVPDGQGNYVNNAPKKETGKTVQRLEETDGGRTDGDSEDVVTLRERSD